MVIKEKENVFHKISVMEYLQLQRDCEHLHSKADHVKIFQITSSVSGNSASNSEITVTTKATPSCVVISLLLLVLRNSSKIDSLNA